MRYFKVKKRLFQLRYIYGKLRYTVHFVLMGFFCKLFIYKGLNGFFWCSVCTFHYTVNNCAKTARLTYKNNFAKGHSVISNSFGKVLLVINNLFYA